MADLESNTMSPTPRRLEVITDTERFAELAPAWDLLEAGETTPFLSHGWFTAWWDAFAGEDGLCVIALWDGEELAGVLPLRRSDGELRAMANVHSPLYRPLAADSDALTQLIDSAAHMNGRLVIESLPADDPTKHAFDQCADVRTLTVPSHTSPIVEIGDDFDAWRSSSKPRWGAPLERFRRKMIRENAAQIETIVAPVDLEAELDAGFVVEASGWKGEQGTAILSSPSTTRFYSDVARAAHARDELRFSRILLDGELAAFDLTLLRGGHLYLLKTGFDERHRRLAPGLVMRLSIIERCFEMKLQAHDLLGHDSEWKRKFATTERHHVTLELFDRGPVSTAEYVWRRRLRPVAKRGADLVRGRRGGSAGS